MIHFNNTLKEISKKFLYHIEQKEKNQKYMFHVKHK